MRVKARIPVLLSGAALTAGAFLADPLFGGTPGFGVAQWGALLAGLSLLLLGLAGGWKRFLLLLGSLAFSLLLCEGVLHLLFKPWFTTLYRPDPVLLHELVPGAFKIYRRLPVNGGRTVPVRVNSLGFRGEEFRPSKDRFRIMVYGDSFVEAEFSPLEETFCKRLEHHLGKERIQVIDAGVVGYGPDQALLKMKEEIPRFRPDLVMEVLFAGNDYGDLVRNRLFLPAAKGTFRPNRPTLSPGLEAAMERALSPWILPKLFQKGLWYFQAHGGTYSDPFRPVESWLAKAKREVRDYLDHPGAPVSELFTDDYDADLALEPASPSGRLKVRLMKAVLAGTAAWTRKEGVPLVLLIVPSPIDVCPAYDVRVNREAHPAYRPENLTDPLVKIAGDLQVPALDLFGPFRENEPERLYFHGTNDHWNARGQDLAARLAAAFLRKAGKIPPF